MIKFLTAGESHGQSLTAIVEGIPSGLSISVESINRDLKRRQAGYGRGGRMQIESDTVEITSGVRFGKALGSPITLLIRNQDWINWQEKMAVEPLPEGKTFAPLTQPRPGHADLVGAIKYNHPDIRNVLERSSARETAARVAVGALAKLVLKEFDIQIASQVIAVGSIKCDIDITTWSIPEIYQATETSLVHCVSPETSQQMQKEIDQTKENGDTLGGIFEILTDGLPIGLGSYTQWDTRLDGRLAQAVMSIPAIKGVEFGTGFQVAYQFGSQVHDAILYANGKFIRKTNNAGGLEGGLTNGERLVVRAAMKPISTLMNPLPSVDLVTKEKTVAAVERSDICAVPAAAVVGEAMVAVELCKAMQEKFGGDSIEEMKRNYASYQEYIKRVVSRQNTREKG
ncbi:MAG: chorismate synthase [bacterium]|nr:chorismate synthase [bacterium]